MRERRRLRQTLTGLCALAVVVAGAAVAIPPRAIANPPTTFSYTGPPVPIPDSPGADVPGTPAVATLPVSGLTGVVSHLTFSIDGTACSDAAGSTTVGLDHTFVNDLQLTLTAPNGVHALVIDRTDGGGNNFCQTVLDDNASQSIQSVTTSQAPFTGTFTPDTPLSTFNGIDPNGNWSLTAQDFFVGDTGNIRAFSLIISTAEPTISSTVPTWPQVAVSPNPATVGEPVAASATLHPEADGGTVQFNVDGSNVGNPVPVSGSTANTTLTGLTAGQHLVTATYSGDDTYQPSSNNIALTVNGSGGPGPTPTPTPTDSTPAVVNPTITAALSSATTKTATGWYRSPVTITYTCTAGSAPLDANGCPSPVTVNNGMLQTVTRTVTATDGGSGTATSVVNVDRNPPRLQLHGAHNHHTYHHPRTITCTASDPLSGLAAPCAVTTTHHGHKVHYAGTVTDNAGNTTHKHGTYTLKS
jgi:subtilisin-like proprotein convertase family protein